MSDLSIRIPRNITDISSKASISHNKYEKSINLKIKIRCNEESFKEISELLNSNVLNSLVITNCDSDKNWIAIYIDSIVDNENEL